jgi:DmsE family decaheme c-type cytochrome
MCHEGIGKAAVKSLHEAVDLSDKHGFKCKACESCHGPGSNHVQSLSPADIRNPAKLSPAETDRTCLTCHRNQPTTSGRLEASHAHNAIACTSCHSIHSPQGLVVRKPAEINTLCESCHIDVKASFAEPFKHQVPENAMTCVDSHNPHGSFKPGLMRMANANEPGCFNCHSDKRGPFTFEHAPVREEAEGAPALNPVSCFTVRCQDGRVMIEGSRAADFRVPCPLNPSSVVIVGGRRGRRR